MTTFNLDNFELDDPQGRWRIENATALPAMPTPENVLVTAPFVDGAAGVAGAIPAQPFALSLFISNDRQISHDTVIQRASFLAGKFGQAKNLVMVTANNDPLYAEILKVTASEPKMRRDRLGAIVVANFDLQPYWHTENPIIDTATTSGGPILYSPFAGMTAPPQDLIVKLSGPFQSVKITDPHTGQYFVISHELRTGQWLYLDVAGRVFWTSSLDYAWTRPSNIYPADYGVEGAPNFQPEITGNGSAGIRLHLEFTGIEGTVTTQVRGRKWYL